MGQKYLPTIRDQNAAQRYLQQQQRRLRKEQPATPTQPQSARPVKK